MTKTKTRTKLARKFGLREKVPDNKVLNLTQVNHRNVLEYADIKLIIMLCVLSIKLKVIYNQKLDSP